MIPTNLGRLFYKASYLCKQFVNEAFSRKYLFYTNVLLSASLSASGDILEQTYEVHLKEIKKIDIKRTVHVALSGCIAGVFCHHWYRFLDKIITGHTFDMVIKKLLLDQFICSPVIILSFFATIAIFEDNPIEDFTDEVNDKFWQLYKAEWVIWPPAQIFNFYYLPTKYRVLYDNTISLGYDIYSSHVKHRKTKKHSNNKLELQ